MFALEAHLARSHRLGIVDRGLDRRLVVAGTVALRTRLFDR